MDRLDLKRARVFEALRDVPRWERQQGMCVAQLMTASPQRIAADATLDEVIAALRLFQFRHLVVTGPEGNLVGVISDRDIPASRLESSSTAEPPRAILARDLMSTDVLTITPRAPLEEAVGLILRHGISCLPVVEEGILVGILTSTDLLVATQILLRLLPRPPLDGGSTEELLAESLFE